MRSPPWFRLTAIATVAACAKSPTPDIVAQGTVEVPQIDISAMVPARVVTIRVEEGGRVTAGDTLALLSQSDTKPNLEAARARVRTAEANQRDLVAGSRVEEIRTLEAELHAAEAEAARASKDWGRIRALADGDVVSKQQLDAVVTADRVASDRRDMATQALKMARSGPRPERIRGAEAEVANAKAALGAVEARASDLVLTAPVAGIVLGRHAEPGEFLAAGTPVLTVGETGRPWVRIFVAQRDLGRVTLGQSVSIIITGDPARQVHGTVSAITPRAEFTPRVALTEEERADLMFGVKVALDDPDHRLSPGLWAKVTVSGKAAP